MNWNAVPVAMIAGITGYAAILFYGLYLALAQRTDAAKRREYLTFALTCASAAAYDICGVGLYDASSIAHGVMWQRGQMFAAAFIGIGYIAFVWDFFRRPTPIAVRVAMVVLGALGLLVALWESPWTLTAARPAAKQLFFFGNVLTYYEAERGAIARALQALLIAVYLTPIGNMLWHFRSQTRGTRRESAGFTLAAVVLASTAISDVLVSEAVYSFIYTFEYAITALLLSMGYVLLMRFGEPRDDVSASDRSPTETNTDLAVALEQTNESIRLKTELLAFIAHELRAPLNAIINLPEGLNAQFQSKSRIVCGGCEAEFELEEGETLDEHVVCSACGAAGLKEKRRKYFVGDADKAQACLTTVSRAGTHLLGLVNDVLDASKLELGRAVIVPSLFDPIALIAEVIDSAQTVADKKHVSIRIIKAPEGTPTGPIVADRVKLGQVLYNLIGNAIKFSPDNAAVEVSYSEPSPGESVICVRDYGIGIDKADHRVIFEKFKQVDRGATGNDSGAGLGLAISKGLVELHGGRIWVESRKGNGASFFVHLPPIALPDNTDVDR
jgi:signal transduction histidine kinase